MQSLRTVLHCDLDCFYAQVERERLGLPKDAAVAVVQWGSTLAVSYPAREYGIKRGSHVDEIRRLAGDKVKIVSVETISASNVLPSRHLASSPASPVVEGRPYSDAENILRTTSSSTQPNVEQKPPSGNSVNTTTTAETHTGVPPIQGNKSAEKVTLARYRGASARVFAAIARAVHGMGATIERASIDEAFIDISMEVTRRTQKPLAYASLPPDTYVVGGKIDTSIITDSRLAHGAMIASAIRKRVLEECSFTMSAGISVNKLLSKFASASNKPNKQTIVPLCSVSNLLRNVPLAKLRGLGGKLGKDVETFGVTTAGEATSLTMKQLIDGLGNPKAADFVYKSVRGIDETEVKARDLPKSLLAAKSFDPEKRLGVVEHTWVPVLAEELVDRLEEDSQINHRDANTLTVTFRVIGQGTNDWVTVSRSTSMPRGSGETRKCSIMKAGMLILHTVLVKEKQFKFPISMIGLTACNFIERATGKDQISSFFESRKGDNSTGVGEHENAFIGNGKVDHKRRLQEKADRDLALRLHRVENSHVISRKFAFPAPAKPRGVAKRKSNNNNNNSLKGVSRVDTFFTRRS